MTDTEETTNSKENTLEQTLKKLVELENGNVFVKAKEIINSRNNARKYLKSELEQKSQLPENSGYFAGLVTSQGRIKWKDVAYELISKYNISEEEFYKIVKKCQPNSYKVMYGKQEQRDEEKFNQLKFRFITPMAD